MNECDKNRCTEYADVRVRFGEDGEERSYCDEHLKQLLSFGYMNILVKERGLAPDHEPAGIQQDLSELR